MNDIIIRETIHPGDIAQIILFHADYYSKKYGWNYEFEAYVAKPLAELALREDENERLWIIDSNDKVMGAIALTKIDNQTAQLRWFYIKPELRGMGYGKLLVEKLPEFAGKCNYNKIILWTTSDLVEAASLYIKYGFKIEEEITHEIWGKVVTEQKYVKKL